MSRTRMASPALSTLLRAAVLAASAAIVAAPRAVGLGIAAGALGAFAGVVLADRAAKSPLRLGAALAAAAAAALGGALLVRLLVGSPLVAGLLGPRLAFGLGEATRWLALAGPLAFAVRFLAARRPLLAVLELVTVGGAFAAAFAAHRDGRVHRPFAIGDWAMTRGLDPALVFLALGGAATLLLAVLLVSEDRRRRLPLHLTALVVVALALLLFVRVEGLPKPQPSGDLGLTGDPRDASGEGLAGGDGTDRRPPEDLPFKNEYASQGGEAPVAVVVLHDDYSPPTGVYYFRQSAFSQWNGERLVQATRDDVDKDVVARFPARRIEVPWGPPAPERRALLQTTTGLLVDHVRPFSLDSPRWFEPAPNPQPLRFQRVFETSSAVPTVPYERLLGDQPGAMGWSDPQWRHYTEAPADPRYRELVEQILARLLPEYRQDPLAQALAIKIHLDENGIYSRKSQHAGTVDPTADFLFGDLTGYCVHFAHAAVFLMRTAGLPARVAAGYAVPEASRAGGSALMIRGLNAHAWPELYLAGAGWVVIDPSPERSLDEEASPADPSLQRMLGEMMRQTPGQDELRRASWWTASRVLRLLLITLLAAVLAGLGVKLWRGLVPLWAAPGELPRVAYRAALDRLVEAGHRRRPGESREGFARRLLGRTPAFVTLTREHLRAALGGGPTASPPALRALPLEVGGELDVAVPAWRRLLGILDPFSWLRAR